MNNVQAKYAKLRAEHRALGKAAETKYSFGYQSHNMQKIGNRLVEIEAPLIASAIELITWAAKWNKSFEIAANCTDHFYQKEKGEGGRTFVLDLADIALQLPGGSDDE